MLAENLRAAVDEVLRLKPSTAKGRYERKAALSTTMGPSVLVDITAKPVAAVAGE